MNGSRKILLMARATGEGLMHRFPDPEYRTGQEKRRESGTQKEEWISISDLPALPLVGSRRDIRVSVGRVSGKNRV
jgi:hypothetical protein